MDDFLCWLMLGTACDGSPYPKQQETQEVSDNQVTGYMQTAGYLR